MNLRTRFERFCFRNRDKGIPNLMLYITLGSAIVLLLALSNTGGAYLYNLLYFDRALILQGQVWRLFTYVFTFDSSNIFFTIIGLICYYSLGRAMENIWGTLRFNLFYLSGVLMMDIFCLLFGGQATISSLNLSLFLAYATMYPNATFLLLFIIPVKAWIFAVFDLLLTAYDVFMLATAGLFPFCLYPLVAIANYLLFFGKDVRNVFPLSWRINASRLFSKKTKKAAKGQTIPFAGSYEASTASVKAPYTHRCTICGRTDVSNPELEFRYCSRCNGYFCYCEDHINNHTHVE